MLMTAVSNMMGHVKDKIWVWLFTANFSSTGLKSKLDLYSPATVKNKKNTCTFIQLPGQPTINQKTQVKSFSKCSQQTSE